MLPRSPSLPKFVREGVRPQTNAGNGGLLLRVHLHSEPRTKPTCINGLLHLNNLSVNTAAFFGTMGMIETAITAFKVVHPVTLLPLCSFVSPSRILFLLSRQ